MRRFLHLMVALLCVGVLASGCGAVAPAKLPASEQPVLLSLLAVVSGLERWQATGDALGLTPKQIERVLPLLREVEIRSTLAEPEAKEALQRLWGQLTDAQREALTPIFRGEGAMGVMRPGAGGRMEAARNLSPEQRAALGRFNPGTLSGNPGDRVLDAISRLVTTLETMR